MSSLFVPEFLAYVGPGAGLTMLGALLAVACVLLLALLSPLLYMYTVCRRLIRNLWMRKLVNAELQNVGSESLSESVERH